MDSNADITTPPAGAVTDAFFWQAFAVAIFLGVLAIVFVGIRAQLINSGNIDMIIGVMLGWVSMIVGYRWGTSAGSTSKDAAMVKLAVQTKESKVE